MYVAFEGIDGVGKTTQISLLKNWLKEQKIEAVFTKEPGGIGDEIRNLALWGDYEKKANLFLFLADRAEHFTRVIKPNLSKTIVSDRSYISGISYALSWFDFDFLKNINAFCMDNISIDKVIFLHADENTIKQRFAGKNLDKIEERGIEYFLKTQENIQKTLDLLKINYLKLNANDDKINIFENIKEFLLNN